MARGAHIRVYRDKVLGSGYWHHGIQAGPDEVIHFNGGPLTKLFSAVSLERTSVASFLSGGERQVVRYRQCDPPSLVMKRAFDALNNETFVRWNGNYNLLERNCEHFARWCKTGKAWSEQAEGPPPETGEMICPSCNRLIVVNENAVECYMCGHKLTRRWWPPW